MSRNTEENKKKYNKIIDNKKRKLQEAEIARKKKLKEITKQFNDKKTPDKEA